MWASGSRRVTSFCGIQQLATRSWHTGNWRNQCKIWTTDGHAVYWPVAQMLYIRAKSEFASPPIATTFSSECSLRPQKARRLNFTQETNFIVNFASHRVPVACGVESSHDEKSFFTRTRFDCSLTACGTIFWCSRSASGTRRHRHRYRLQTTSEKVVCISTSPAEEETVCPTFSCRLSNRTLMAPPSTAEVDRSRCRRRCSQGTSEGRRAVGGRELDKTFLKVRRSG